MPQDQHSAPLVKSRQRVADHGEVFTPDWMVEDMLAQVADEADRIGSRFLEPACGDGNFLAPILKRKLATVEARYGKSQFERAHQALFALMSIYGIELLDDNAEACRRRLVAIFVHFLGDGANPEWAVAGMRVMEANVILGDAMTMRSPDGGMIHFPEWAYLGKGKFQRRDFALDNLSQRSQVQGTLFDHLTEHEVFVPARVHPPMSVKEMAA